MEAVTNEMETVTNKMGAVTNGMGAMTSGMGAGIITVIIFYNVTVFYCIFNQINAALESKSGIF